MSSLSSVIRETLSAIEVAAKKQITLFLETPTLEKLDRISKEFSKLNESRNFSRNTLIELAINEFIKESAIVLQEDHGINIEVNDSGNDTGEDSSHTEYFDLAIYPARNEGFNHVFLDEDMWYSVRISKNRFDHIKYVACYRAAPVSGITHYAKVKEIVPHGDGKFRIIFDGKAIELPRVVMLGDTNATAMRPPRYTTLEKLRAASVVRDLFE